MNEAATASGKALGHRCLGWSSPLCTVLYSRKGAGTVNASTCSILATSFIIIETCSFVQSYLLCMNMDNHYVYSSSHSMPRPRGRSPQLNL